jgi:transposase-like protein
MSRMAKIDGRRTRRKFSDEFRAGAIRLVLDEGRTAGSVARELRLERDTLEKRPASPRRAAKVRVHPDGEGRSPDHEALLVGSRSHAADSTRGENAPSPSTLSAIVIWTC